MSKLRRRRARGLENQPVFERVGQMVLAANNVANAQVGIVCTRSQVISRHAVAAQQSEVFDVGGGLHLLAVHCVSKSHPLAALARHAKTQTKWFSCGGAAARLGRREVTHYGIEKPSLRRAGSLAFSGMCRGKIAVGKPLLENSFGHAAMKLDAFGLLVFFVPPQVQPLQSFKNGID